MTRCVLCLLLCLMILPYHVAAHGGTSATMNLRSDPKEKRVNTVQAKGKEPTSSQTTKQGKEPISSETTKHGKEPISSDTTKHGKEPISSETTTKRPRGRPRKIPKQTNETTSDCAKSKTTHIQIASDKEPKKEADNEMEKHAMANQEVDCKSDLARTLLSLIRRGSTDPTTDPEMRKQENGDPAEASAKSTPSAVKKFYMRRNNNQSFKK